MHDRRFWLQAALAAPLAPLAACSAALPVSLNASTSKGAQALLADSAAAHGLTSFRALQDLNISYAGEWRALVGQVEPGLVDPSFGGKSEERLLLREGIVAQAHTGSGGRKYVLRQTRNDSPGEVRVWFNGEEARDGQRRGAVAMAADTTTLALLGPLLLADRTLVMQLAELETVGDYECDVLRIQLAPGLGFSRLDPIQLYIDTRHKLVRRVRFPIERLQSMRGAIAEIEPYDHVTLHGVRWPTRFYERLVRPIRLPLHDWNLTGLDVNRGLDAAEVAGPQFTGKALAPAAQVAQLPAK
jgi:hypothetical protein